ncbi:hypothetical protein BD413DRAFT_284489 [Trametes elegans]|nr:hypothetical protein BD413DRAFT_284489 [Trametes elegans]
MRVSTLSAVCAAALVFPASAAPLAETTKVVIPIVGATMTFELNAPSEIPNPPLPTVPTAPAVPTGGTSQAHRLSKGKLAGLPRGAGDFRQADYGVNSDATFTEVPINGVEASPSTTAAPATATHRRRSDDDWEDARLKPEAYYAGDSSSALPDAAPDATAAAKPEPPPLAVGNLKNADTNHVPAHPNLSSASRLSGQSVKMAGDSRYATAYSAHDLLGGIFGTASPAMEQSRGVAKAPTQLNKAGAHGLLRRILRPASYITNPFRRAFGFAKDLSGHNFSKGVGGHTLQLDTDPLLPSRSDPTLNMSDPYTAQEEQRRKHTGVLNIDSNRAAPPPPAPLTTDTPLNATNTTTGALDGETGDTKKAAPVQLDKAAKNATTAA